MSFGFALGDFIAIGHVIYEINNCLQAASNAEEEYQELVRELKLLAAALRHLDKLDNATGSSITIDSIKCAALSCHQPLQCFLTKAQKYDAALGIRGQVSPIQGAKRKLQWTFVMKDDIKRLQCYLQTHVGTINILLTQHGLERMDVARTVSEEFKERVQGQLDIAHDFLTTISDNVSAQMSVINNVQRMLIGLHQLISGELKASWNRFGISIAQVCVATQQIYGIVLEIRESVKRPDVRWSHFQAPLLIEDALGRKFPVPSEGDYGMLDTLLKYKFKAGPGSRHVRAGYYEICKSSKKSEVLTPTSPLVPGMALTMAIILPTKHMSRVGHCPMPRCGGTEATACLDGDGSIWQVTRIQRRCIAYRIPVVVLAVSGTPKLRKGEKNFSISIMSTIKVKMVARSIPIPKNISFGGT